MSDGRLPLQQIDGLAAYIAGIVTTALADLTAADVSFDPETPLTSTDVQAAILEVYAAIGTAVDAVAASDVGFTPVGTVAATDVQAAIAEIDSELPARISSAVAAVVDSAPATLDTLNELAAALGDDPNFATTITTLIGTKLSTADFLAALTATLVPGDNVAITPVDDTLVIDSTGTGGGAATTRWEVWVGGVPAEPLLTPDGTDYIYVEVPI